MHILEAVSNRIGKRTHLPTTVKELEVLSQKENKRCTCNACTPKASILICIRPFHSTIPPLLKNMTTNRFGIAVFAPPKLPSRFSLPIEGQELVHTIIRYFDQPPSHLNNNQLDALTALRTFREDYWNEILTIHPKPPYGNSLLPAPTMLHLWQSINTLFFGRPISHATFRWKEMKCCYGRASPGLRGPTIHINHKLPPCEFGDYTLLAFLSVLVHESIHVFLQYYACWLCGTWKKDCASEHGRHFQTIAQKIEEVFPKLVGLPVRLGRFEGFLGDLGTGEREKGWVKRWIVPSMHDLEVWRFEDVKFTTNEKVKGVIERVYAERYTYCDSSYME